MELPTRTEASASRLLSGRKRSSLGYQGRKSPALRSLWRGLRRNDGLFCRAVIYQEWGDPAAGAAGLNCLENIVRELFSLTTIMLALNKLVKGDLDYGFQITINYGMSEDLLQYHYQKSFQSKYMVL